jgi:hypothetical protein
MRAATDDIPIRIGAQGKLVFMIRDDFLELVDESRMRNIETPEPTQSEASSLRATAFHKISRGFGEN